MSDIRIIKANENNLKNISITIPRNKLTVITGVSGSGKSSLAFDTLYAEGQRRYMETFSTYARQFIGDIERPDVEAITGLSPVISIEQKTTAWNPRSTVGTITEIYDFFRLLYARIGDAFSFVTGNKMVQLSLKDIQRQIKKDCSRQKIILLAPVVRGRKGHYRDLFVQIKKKGYQKVRVNGEIIDIVPDMQVDRYKTHDIEIVIDRIKVDDKKTNRLNSAIETALDIGENLLFVFNVETGESKLYSTELMDPESGVAYETPSPNTFSFNSPYGACPKCKGLGVMHSVNADKVIPDATLSVKELGLPPLGEVRKTNTYKQLQKILKKANLTFKDPINAWPDEILQTVLYGSEQSNSRKKAKNYNDYMYDLGSVGLINYIKKTYEETESERLRAWAENFMSQQACEECHGFRLKTSSLHFKLREKHIGELAKMNLSDLLDWVGELPFSLNEQQILIAGELLKEIYGRLMFMNEVGLGYLNMDRPARTLSGGESQRTRLATQIGSKLTGITYILDEPSIGLHQRDNDKLIQSLKDLTKIGNTVVVVEHDKDIMLQSDMLIDLGPFAGHNGGEIVGVGNPKEFAALDTITADYLASRNMQPIPEKRREGNGNMIELFGAVGHNLRGDTLRMPLGTFICVTGVSGSGKSTLINETLYPIIRKHLYNSIKNPLQYEVIKGMEYVDKVIEVDQSPIGRTPRSNPATYTGMFTEIRKLFAKVPESQVRGYKVGRFSFNVKGGRCETCGGAGKRLIEMNFLPDVLVDCETCQGQRYNRETLEIIYKGKNISDVLEMTVNDGVLFFKNIPKIYKYLKIMKEIGLGYISLGQSAPSLSGGEAQRIKLAEELAKRDTGNTLYILDEPSTGLHYYDIQHLLTVLQKLVEKGNTVLIIEHNMDIIKMADYLIDLGPEGGDKGGQIVFQGKTEQIIDVENSYTAQYLKKELRQ